MRALSVQQPWAHLIAQGLKTLEVRSWRTRYRGRIVIVAGRKASSHPAAHVHLRAPIRWPRGVTVCTVEIVDVVHGERAHADRTGGVDPTGEYCWVLRDPRPIEHRAAKGRLGLWDLDISLDPALYSDTI